MKYNIRKIEENDFSYLISLFQEFALFEKLPDKMVNSLEQMRSEQDYILGFVATTNTNEVVGYVTFFYAYYTWVGKSLYMDDLYVKKSCRGNGIGTQLIKKIIDQARVTNCNRLRWQVSNWNKPAIKFYKSLGATVNGVESNCDLNLR
jgi:GNAT superfamily N-acetyltransferase